MVAIDDWWKSVDRSRFPEEFRTALDRLVRVTINNWPGRDWSGGEDDDVSTEYRVSDYLLFCAHDIFSAPARIGPGQEGNLPGFGEPKRDVQTRLRHLTKALDDIAFLNKTQALWGGYAMYEHSMDTHPWSTPIRVSISGMMGTRPGAETFQDVRILKYLPDFLESYISFVRERIELAKHDRLGNRERALQKHQFLRLIRGNTDSPHYGLASDFLSAFADYKGIPRASSGPDELSEEALRKFATRAGS